MRRPALDSSRAQVAALTAQIRQSQTSLDTARTNLGYTRIVAPIAGTVVAVVAQQGQTLNAVQSSPTIVKIARLDQVTVRAEISEADVMRVKPGQTVYFTTLGAPDRRYYARLRSIAPAPESIEETAAAGSSGSADEAVYYDGYFDVDNQDRSLRISMTVQVNVVLDHARQALLIPSSALGEKTAGGDPTVRVVDAEGRISTRAVRIGIDDRASAQVLSGLKPGERVVVAEAPPSPAVAEEPEGDDETSPRGPFRRGG